MLNGQPSLRSYWHKIEISISNLKLLLLSNDGFVPLIQERELAREMVSLYKRGRPSLDQAEFRNILQTQGLGRWLTLAGLSAVALAIGISLLGRSQTMTAKG